VMVSPAVAAPPVTPAAPPAPPVAIEVATAAPPALVSLVAEVATPPAPPLLATPPGAPLPGLPQLPPASPVEVAFALLPLVELNTVVALEVAAPPAAPVAVATLLKSVVTLAIDVAAPPATPVPPLWPGVTPLEPLGPMVPVLIYRSQDDDFGHGTSSLAACRTVREHLSTAICLPWLRRTMATVPLRRQSAQPVALFTKACFANESRRTATRRRSQLRPLGDHRMWRCDHQRRRRTAPRDQASGAGGGWSESRHGVDQSACRDPGLGRIADDQPAVEP